VTVDDNAVFRHPGNAELAVKYLSALEREAAKNGLAYVEMDGDLAIIGNGAGLVMATLDAVRDFGGKPANFCDAGGGATREMVEKAMEIVMQKKSVKAVFINIFGGITHCDIVAQGILDYSRKNKLSLPVTVRMVGTNGEEGRKLLKEAGIGSFEKFEEAAKTAAGAINPQTR
jgi:succinyl-CoA synthetase beta subunit